MGQIRLDCSSHFLSWIGTGIVNYDFWQAIYGSSKGVEPPCSLISAMKIIISCLDTQKFLFYRTDRIFGSFLLTLPPPPHSTVGAQNLTPPTQKRTRL